MSQQQSQAKQSPDQEPVKYGDVFNVSGELASKPVAPRDAASMQATENLVLGHTQKGGPAAVMQSAATENERRGLVGHNAVTNIPRDQGVTVSETTVGGARVVAESVGGQIVGRFVEPAVNVTSPGSVFDRNAITIGEALEATALSAGDKPVDQGDAAAIQAAENRAFGSNATPLGGIGASAHSAATLNTRTIPYADKTKISDVLTNAREKLPGDKAVTREDAECVIRAEIRNKADMRTTPGGVAASMAVSATLNQNE